MEPNSSSQLASSVVKTSNKLPMLVAGGIAIILIGLGIGFVASSKKTNSKSATSGSSVIISQTEAGAKDASAFKDTATGVLQKGGIKGEGTFHLDRPGGVSQTVYLNSTVINMNTFVGKTVQVWGETITSQHAPWLMDVGKLKVVQ